METSSILLPDFTSASLHVRITNTFLTRLTEIWIHYVLQSFSDAIKTSDLGGTISS